LNVIRFSVSDISLFFRLAENLLVYTTARKGLPLCTFSHARAKFARCSCAII